MMRPLFEDREFAAALGKTQTRLCGSILGSATGASFPRYSNLETWYTRWHRNPDVGKQLGTKIYSPKDYWGGVAEKFRSSDGSGLAPVLHPGAPAWFNVRIDDLQFRAMRRALGVAQL